MSRGQMYTLEALLASLIIFGTIIFAINASPRFGTETKEFTTLQLKKYADDILEILDLETSTHESLLSEWIENGIKNNYNFSNTTWKAIELNLRKNLSIMMHVEVLDPNGSLVYSFGPPPPRGAVSSFRVVPVLTSPSSPPYAYEVRLYLWYV